MCKNNTKEYVVIKMLNPLACKSTSLTLMYKNTCSSFNNNGKTSKLVSFEL